MDKNNFLCTTCNATVAIPNAHSSFALGFMFAVELIETNMIDQINRLATLYRTEIEKPNETKSPSLMEDHVLHSDACLCDICVLSRIRQERVHDNQEI